MQHKIKTYTKNFTNYIAYVYRELGLICWVSARARITLFIAIMTPVGTKTHDNSHYAGTPNKRFLMLLAVSFGSM